MATTKSATLEYVDKSDARVPRKRKTAVVEQQLMLIVKRRGGLTAAMVVEEARSENHPLHGFFEWQDDVAAEKYRLAQATQMILATKFVCMLVEKRNAGRINELLGKAVNPHVVRKLLPDFTEKQTVYRPRAEVLSKDESRKAIVERKIGALRAWCESVVDIPDLTRIREGVLGLIG